MTDQKRILIWNGNRLTSDSFYSLDSSYWKVNEESGLLATAVLRSAYNLLRSKFRYKLAVEAMFQNQGANRELLQKEGANPNSAALGGLNSTSCSGRPPPPPFRFGSLRLTPLDPSLRDSFLYTLGPITTAVQIWCVWLGASENQGVRYLTIGSGSPPFSSASPSRCGGASSLDLHSRLSSSDGEGSVFLCMFFGHGGACLKLLTGLFGCFGSDLRSSAAGSPLWTRKRRSVAGLVNHDSPSMWLAR
ncbi:LOW QUALITY PROTEIN: hypothetical protein HID58_040863 [Brassica napus]|uniref:Uncharacterized protein n=1 Tax=Brassica napus TaxID=3708 RepID=A0ABQ8BAR8_BRANA|nr:LOW QUALITY PROTEIN: hypothetical protein HID58_040863 [Brassica napus]